MPWRIIIENTIIKIGSDQQMKRLLTYFSLIFVVFSVSCNHNVDDFSSLKDAPFYFFQKVSATPYLFLGRVKKSFDLYYQKNGCYPKYWSECEPITFEGEKVLVEVYRSTGKGDRPIKDEDKVLNLEKKSILTTYDRVEDKKYYFRYRIVRSDNQGFEINVESNYFPYVWATDGIHLWHFYKYPEEENKIVEEMNRRILSGFTGETERNGLIYKMIMLKNEKALSYYISYLKKFKNDYYTVLRMIYSLQESPILTKHKEYKENVKAAADRYPDDKDLQKYTNDVLLAFDKDIKIAVRWKGIEEWVFMIPYGVNVAEER